jgi:hypothetical protein
MRKVRVGGEHAPPEDASAGVEGTLAGEEEAASATARQRERVIHWARRRVPGFMRRPNRWWGRLEDWGHTGHWLLA